MKAVLGRERRGRRGGRRAGAVRGAASGGGDGVSRACVGARGASEVRAAAGVVGPPALLLDVGHAPADAGHVRGGGGGHGGYPVGGGARDGVPPGGRAAAEELRVRAVRRRQRQTGGGEGGVGGCGRPAAQLRAEREHVSLIRGGGRACGDNAPGLRAQMSMLRLVRLEYSELGTASKSRLGFERAEKRNCAAAFCLVLPSRKPAVFAAPPQPADPVEIERCIELCP
jgi:hypothetical protein